LVAGTLFLQLGATWSLLTLNGAEKRGFYAYIRISV
jgi:hypothetical protein